MRNVANFVKFGLKLARFGLQETVVGPKLSQDTWIFLQKENNLGKSEIWPNWPIRPSGG